jgi:hypothetical protein
MMGLPLCARLEPRRADRGRPGHAEPARRCGDGPLDGPIVPSSESTDAQRPGAGAVVDSSGFPGSGTAALPCPASRAACRHAAGCVGHAPRAADLHSAGVGPRGRLHRVRLGTDHSRHEPVVCVHGDSRERGGPLRVAVAGHVSSQPRRPGGREGHRDSTRPGRDGGFAHGATRGKWCVGHFHVALAAEVAGHGSGPGGRSGEACWAGCSAGRRTHRRRLGRRRLVRRPRQWPSDSAPGLPSPSP